MSYVMAKFIHDMNIYHDIQCMPITVDCLQVTILSLKVEFAMPLSSYGTSTTSVIAGTGSLKYYFALHCKHICVFT